MLRVIPYGRPASQSKVADRAGRVGDTTWMESKTWKTTNNALTRSWLCSHCESFFKKFSPLPPLHFIQPLLPP